MATQGNLFVNKYTTELGLHSVLWSAVSVGDIIDSSGGRIKVGSVSVDPQTYNFKLKQRVYCDTHWCEIVGVDKDVISVKRLDSLFGKAVSDVYTICLGDHAQLDLYQPITRGSC